MGVFPNRSPIPASMIGLPHARGGVSHIKLHLFVVLTSSPRPWGCFSRACPQGMTGLVFPTPVGVFLILPTSNHWSKGLPHARGGVSLVFVRSRIGKVSSPRPWGCFQQHGRPRAAAPVFPTPVGVFLAPFLALLTTSRLPHARGGVSLERLGWRLVGRSSPRPWGCFQ